MVSSESARLSLIEYCKDLVERHKSMIGLDTMDMYSGRPFEVYIANLSAEWNFFTQHMVGAYA